MAFYVVTYPSFDVVEEHDEYSQAQRRAAKLSTRMRQVWAVDENQLYGARKRCEAVRQSEVAQAQPAPAPKRRPTKTWWTSDQKDDHIHATQKLLQMFNAKFCHVFMYHKGLLQESSQRDFRGPRNFPSARR